MRVIRKKVTSTVGRFAVNTADAARYIGVSEALLRKMRTEGNGPIFSKVNTKIVYPISELKKFIEKNLIGGGGKC